VINSYRYAEACGKEAGGATLPTVVGKGAVLCKVEASDCKTLHHGNAPTGAYRHTADLDSVIDLSCWTRR
jgi:hypothetical protein